MEKITIKGFGPIKDAEIEVKKLLVLIGEQASGKSTIAKLIYFFKGLARILGPIDPTDLSKEAIKILKYPAEEIQWKFSRWFGGHSENEDFYVKYDYSEDKFIEISCRFSKEVVVSISDSISSGLAEALSLYENLKLNADKSSEPKSEEGHFVPNFFSKMGESFGLNYRVSRSYFPAGREAVLSYEFAFNSYFRNEAREHRSGRGNALLPPPVADEELLLEFLDFVDALKHRFHGFDSVLNHDLTPPLPQIRSMIENHVEHVLRATYSDTGSEEYLNVETSRIKLHHASSGQKASIRILQDVALQISTNWIDVLRIIEEPEAHLFPVAQKHLIELLALLANHREENQVIITTHSPYVLTTFNNLLFATRVVAKNPASEEEVAKVAPLPLRIDPATFAAYSLGNSFDPKEPYCVNIVDQEIGMIEQNYLDTVSDLLGMEFDHLRNIHLRSFQDADFA